MQHSVLKQKSKIKESPKLKSKIKSACLFIGLWRIYTSWNEIKCSYCRGKKAFQSCLGLIIFMNNTLVISRDVYAVLLATAWFYGQISCKHCLLQGETRKESSVILMSHIWILESESYQLAKSQLIQIKFHHTSFNKQSQFSHFNDDSY